jgi:hypothetical protein
MLAVSVNRDRMGEPHLPRPVEPRAQRRRLALVEWKRNHRDVRLCRQEMGRRIRGTVVHRNDGELGFRRAYDLLNGAAVIENWNHNAETRGGRRLNSGCRLRDQAPAFPFSRRSTKKRRFRVPSGSWSNSISAGAASVSSGATFAAP